MIKSLKPTNFLHIFLILVFSACAINKDFYLDEQKTSPISENEDIFHTIYFLGGSDEVKLKESKIGQLISDQMEISGKKSTLLLLGNNSLRNTTFDADSSKKSFEKRELLKRRYNFFNELNGKYYAVMGPHEWSNGTKKGMEGVRILEEIIEDGLDQGDIIKPAFGCPGPEEIEIGEDLVLLLIDTQWLFHNWEKPKVENGCGAESNLDFYVNLDDAIKRNYNKKIIVAGYHSLDGNGRHGGYFPAKSHFTPFPVLGSIKVLLRSSMGNINDLAHPSYKLFIKTMEDILGNHENIIYLSAHEKTLEYHRKKNMHFLNSGSYSKGVEVAQKEANFASGNRGYGRIIYTNNGACILEYWGLKDEQAQLLFRQQLYQGSLKKLQDESILVEKINYSDSLISTFASDLYTKKRKKKKTGNAWQQLQGRLVERNP